MNYHVILTMEPALSEIGSCEGEVIGGFRASIQKQNWGLFYRGMAFLS
ncbi:hypothetical protein SAMN05216352_12417 [Alteribacillus bidgolensis]|uniref:Uncharacterized protein n=1 Tax=Alteribacillus bidgolensis TaxID=930129 RepID=A0A1G8R2W5_9BACI|nr:hypothetical protein SAMN05216352_12417 [Alteribacillus bidgolensis]